MKKLFAMIAVAGLFVACNNAAEKVEATTTNAVESAVNSVDSAAGAMKDSVGSMIDTVKSTIVNKIDTAIKK